MNASTFCGLGLFEQFFIFAILKKVCGIEHSNGAVKRSPPPEQLPLVPPGLGPGPTFPGPGSRPLLGLAGGFRVQKLRPVQVIPRIPHALVEGIREISTSLKGS